MGDQNVQQTSDELEHRHFMKALLTEVRALEDMHAKGMFEGGIRRIGAEQEMFLVDRAHRPALSAVQVLDQINDERFTHELGLFNLEANLSPQELGGSCLRRLHAETDEVVQVALE
ncbi:MAG TPA: hypothetical protein VIC53_09585, partial [Wenzhouxiangella sp.]